MTVDHGHTVPDDGPLWPDTPMSAFRIVIRVLQPQRLPWAVSPPRLAGKLMT